MLLIKEDEERGIAAAVWAIKAAIGMGRTQHRPKQLKSPNHYKMLVVFFDF
jgi:hypothetical protein